MATSAESDGTNGQDAIILDQAAEVLQRRYGRLIAGDLIEALTNRAEAIAKGEG
jgi:hypothetical protein